MPVIGWWHANGPEASLHLVAATAERGEIIGHLQAVDRSLPKPSRRPGQIQYTLNVAPEYRRQGIGGALYAQLETFAERRKARLLYTSYYETKDCPAAEFLKHRGYEMLERFCPSYLDLDTFDPERFKNAIERVRTQAIDLRTYAEVGDCEENRRKLYELEQIARATQPFREVELYVPTPFEEWEQEFSQRDPAAIFLAVAPLECVWVGVVTGLEWYFTGVHPEWRGRGIATALKILCITEAKKRDIKRMDTENHEDNEAMLAINRKLGFIFTTPEVACIKRL